MLGHLDEEAAPLGREASALRRFFSGTAPAAVILLVSLVPRLARIDAPFVFHDFRQTQTAITVQAFLDQGLRVWRYQTPIFGPPWLAPMEFPTFQLSAYPLARLGIPLDVSCRTAALVWFYLSATLLFVLVRRWTKLSVATCALAAYVFSPYSLVWSRACLIDYASVALALGYLIGASAWAADRRTSSAFAAIALGALAFLTKITTLAGYLPALAAILLFTTIRSWSHEVSGKSLARSRATTAAWALAIIAIPFSAGLGWTAWADHLKAGSPATAFLVSRAMSRWNFGTFAQRLDPANWLRIGNWITENVVPGYLALSLPLAAVLAVRRRDALAVIVWAALAGALGAIATFFNLYAVHDYYLISITAPIALLASAGAVELAAVLRFRGAAFAVAALAFLAFWFSPADARARSRWYVNQVYKEEMDESQLQVMRLAQEIKRMTPPDRWVVIEGDDWNPRLLYLSHRRGFMVYAPHTDVAPFAMRPEWGMLVCKNCANLLRLWPAARLIERRNDFTLYDLAPSQPSRVEGALAR